MATNKVKGVHLIGSIPVDNDEEAFRLASKHLSGHVKRLPDGETGDRWNFAEWQGFIFKSEPRVLNDKFHEVPMPYVEAHEQEVLRSFQNIETRYEDHALSSYETFKRLREEGVIPSSVRFQNKIEPLYQKAMLESLRRIQDAIPARDLAIEWDFVAEMMMLEGEKTFFDFSPWFGPVLDGIVQRLAALVDAVDAEVDVGLHCCYGDAKHKHLVEPQHLGTIVGLVNEVVGRSKRPSNWIHMPVPQDRGDRAYFAPLQNLKSDPNTTDIVLGLVHYNDFDGTKARIARGGEFLGRFLVATECGLGRTPKEQLDDILSTCARVC